MIGAMQPEMIMPSPMWKLYLIGGVSPVPAVWDKASGGPGIPPDGPMRAPVSPQSYCTQRSIQSLTQSRARARLPRPVGGRQNLGRTFSPLFRQNSHPQ